MAELVRQVHLASRRALDVAREGPPGEEARCAVVEQVQEGTGEIPLASAAAGGGRGREEALDQSNVIPPGLLPLGLPPAAEDRRPSTVSRQVSEEEPASAPSELRKSDLGPSFLRTSWRRPRMEPAEAVKDVLPSPAVQPPAGNDSRTPSIGTPAPGTPVGPLLAVSPPPALTPAENLRVRHQVEQFKGLQKRERSPRRRRADDHRAELSESSDEHLFARTSTFSPSSRRRPQSRLSTFWPSAGTKSAFATSTLRRRRCSTVPMCWHP